MDTSPDISALVRRFLSGYDESAKDEVWRGLSQRFRTFWRERVLADDSRPISDADCDEVIRILDRNGKGNTKDSEAVAKAMVPQGAWRRMFNEFHTNKSLATPVSYTHLDVYKRQIREDVFGQFSNEIKVAALDKHWGLSLIHI